MLYGYPIDNQPPGNSACAAQMSINNFAIICVLYYLCVIYNGYISYRIILSKHSIHITSFSFQCIDPSTLQPSLVTYISKRYVPIFIIMGENKPFAFVVLT